jgi:hypothetical protein
MFSGATRTEDGSNCGPFATTEDDVAMTGHPFQAAGALAAFTAITLSLAGCTETTALALPPHGNGAACATCHAPDFGRWRLTTHAASAAAVLTNTEHNTNELLVNECVACHAPFQAVKHGVGSFVQPLDQTGPWAVNADSARLWEGIKCAVCHDPASTAPNQLAFFDPTKEAYVPVGSTTELCEKCHQAGTDDSRDLAGSVHEGLQCTDCHFVAGSEHSLDPTEACARCHPAVRPDHPDVTKLPTTYYIPGSPINIHFISCASCHSWALPK